MYIQIFYLLKAAFLKKKLNSQQSGLIINQTKKERKYSFLEQIFKQGRYFDETNKKPGNYCN